MWWVTAKRDDGGKSGRILAHLDLLQSLSRPGSFGGRGSGSLQATLRGLVFSLANRRVTQPLVVRVRATLRTKAARTFRRAALRFSQTWHSHVLHHGAHAGKGVVRLAGELKPLTSSS